MMRKIRNLSALVLALALCPGLLCLPAGAAYENVIPVGALTLPHSTKAINGLYLFGSFCYDPWGLKHGLVNTKGEWLLAPDCKEVEVWEDGLVRTKLKDKSKNRYFYYDGEELQFLDYEYVCQFSEGMFAVRKDEKWGLIDRAGNEVAPAIYSRIERTPAGRPLFVYAVSPSAKKPGVERA